MSEKEDIKSKIHGLKDNAELKFVGALYNDVSLVHDYKVPNTIINNSAWKFYYLLIRNLVKKKQLEVVEQVEVDMYLEELGKKALTNYENFGGWNTITKLKQMGKTDNIEASFSDINRFTVLQRMIELNYPVEENWDQYKNTSIDQLEAIANSQTANIFEDINVGDDKVVDLKKGVSNMIAEARKGIKRGLPLYSEMLNSLVNGLALGNITMLAGASGVGKTYLTLSLVMPTIIKEQEPVLILVNEEGEEKWQQELVTWVVNNVITSGLHKEYAAYTGLSLIKSTFYQGNFNATENELLDLAADWIEENIPDDLLNFIEFETYAAHKAIKRIRQFATSKGIKYFIIDTMKLDNDLSAGNPTDQSWLQLQQNMVRIYNAIKPSGLNVHLWVTYQLNKTQRTKFLDQTSLGMSKNVADVVSTLILVRNLTENEKKDGGLKVVKGDYQVTLDEEDDYMVVFLDKNRRGTTSLQTIIKTDKGRNVIQDTGFTKISQEF
ncbi:AAA family ATPase [Vagococcus fluvialis]|uniref:AAA family ATPase n=1 Tax=Vagococcus fluvialis TaxID=2738 RepID=UPI001D0B36EE|nr:AAA family ATPase [Vagococcus fluvialis]UDM72671.1 AAA family ATPase [Vagococcus fluvialis]UDM78394.1 AAA family ATPase [Vagococcus fluvialis]UDM83946.1 AAA family ATPase [Vagococcus fluvialis]